MKKRMGDTEPFGVSGAALGLNFFFKFKQKKMYIFEEKKVTCHPILVIFHVSCVTCHMVPVTYANSPRHRAPPPLVTPPLCREGWFAKTPKNYLFLTDDKITELPFS